MQRRLALIGTALLSGVLVTALIALIEPGGRAHPRLSDSSSEAVSVTSQTVLPLRSADPRGGAPWALRLVRTSRGWICVQVGRYANGRFGELGVDGAFGNDGRIHPAPPRSFAGASQAGAGMVNDECLQPRETFAGQIAALDRSAAFGAQERQVPATDLRQISFGALGTHARAITYRRGRREVTVVLHAPYGAYLIVQPIGRPGFGSGIGAAPGSDDPARLQTPGLTGALTSILFRIGGKSCREVAHGPSCTP